MIRTPLIDCAGIWFVSDLEELRQVAGVKRQLAIFPELWTELLTNDSPSVWIKPGWRARNDVFLIDPEEEIQLRRQALLGDSDAIRKLALYYSMFKDDVPSSGAWIDLDPELSRTNRVLRIHGNGLHEP